MNPGFVFHVVAQPFSPSFQLQIFVFMSLSLLICPTQQSLIEGHDGIGLHLETDLDFRVGGSRALPGTLHAALRLALLAAANLSVR